MARSRWATRQLSDSVDHGPVGGAYLRLGLDYFVIKAVDLPNSNPIFGMNPVVNHLRQKDRELFSGI
jgi:hypothetical protein